MVHAIVRHKVKNQNKWRAVFNKGLSLRKSNGEKSYKIFRNTKDPKEILGIFKWDNLKNAKKFMRSKELKEKMKEAGVSGKPDIYFIK